MNSSCSLSSRNWDDRKRHVTQIRNKFRRDCANLRRSASFDRVHIIKEFHRQARKSEEQRDMELWRSKAALGIVRRIKNDPQPSFSMQISELEEHVDTEIQCLREHMHDDIESFMQLGFDETSEWFHFFVFVSF